MDKFLKKYHGRSLEDSGTVNSDDVKTFSRNLKNYLKRELPDCNIVGYSLGFYTVSSFVEKDGRYVYINYNIPRWGRAIDVNNSSWMENAVLYRTAENAEDYRGGMNHYCGLADIGMSVENLFSERR